MTLIKRDETLIPIELVTYILRDTTHLYSIEYIVNELKKRPSNPTEDNWLAYKQETITGILKNDFDASNRNYENSDTIYNFRANISGPVFAIHFEGRDTDNDNRYKVLVFSESERVVYDWPFNLRDKLTQKITKETGPTFKRYVTSLGYVNALKFHLESYGKQLKNNYTSNRLFKRSDLQNELNKIKDNITLNSVLSNLNNQLKTKYNTAEIRQTQATYNLITLHRNLLEFANSNQNLKSKDIEYMDSLIDNLDSQINKLKTPLISYEISDKIEKVQQKVNTGVYHIFGSTRRDDLDKIIDSIYSYEKELKNRYDKATKESAIQRLEAAPLEHEVLDYLIDKGYSREDLTD